MKVYMETNVYEEAKKRISRIFDEFEEIVIGFSGGKDSTVVFNLALEEAKRRNRTPLKVLFIDQEAEWQHTIDYVKSVMYRKDVEPLWLQIEIKLFNATSHSKEWLYCWEKGGNWIRPKDEISIKENTFGTDRFKDLFGKVINAKYKGIKTAYIAGVRTEESPTRFVAMTSSATYKEITYGNKLGKDHYTFYPIYDWTYSDVWKAIHDNKWKYNKVYDYFYQYGVSPKDMRVSNLHHETAIHELYYLQEIEPETWNKLVARLDGIDTTGKLEKSDSFMAPKKLPFMFKDWKEYRDYLLENLVESEHTKEKFRKKFEELDERYLGMEKIETLYKTEISAILANDHYFTKITNFERNPELNAFRKFKKNKLDYHGGNKYIPVRKGKRK